MKALSLGAAAAWLVVNGYKDIENRTKRTHFRGRIYVHASGKKVPWADYEYFAAICKKKRIKSFPARDEFRRGGIVGTVEIVDCVESSRSVWYEKKCFGYVLRNARKTRFKPYKGQLSFFEVKN